MHTCAGACGAQARARVRVACAVLNQLQVACVHVLTHTACTLLRPCLLASALAEMRAACGAANQAAADSEAAAAASGAVLAEQAARLRTLEGQLAAAAAQHQAELRALQDAACEQVGAGDGMPGGTCVALQRQKAPDGAGAACAGGLRARGRARRAGGGGGAAAGAAHETSGGRSACARLATAQLGRVLTTAALVRQAALVRPLQQVQTRMLSCVAAQLSDSYN